MATLECRLLNASIACYAIKNGQLDIKDANLQALGLQPGSTPTVFVDGVHQINAGFVAETHDGWVVLALRGTLPPFTGDFWAWVDDWMQDFKAGPTDWFINGSKFGQVETGFSDGMLSIWPAASAALNQGRRDDIAGRFADQVSPARTAGRGLLLCRAANL